MMKKQLLLHMLLSAVIMLVLPWSAVTFLKSDAGMVSVILLFFGVDPIYSVISGIFAGRDIRHLWFLPVISAAFFLTGAWIFFDSGEMAFILYAVVYLMIGILAMIISGLTSMFINQHKMRKQDHFVS